MKKGLLTALAFVGAFALIAPTASAKCFAFSDADIKVCIDGNNNAARGAASEVCEDVTGSDCGNTTGYSGECRGSGCYDGDGDSSSHLTAD